MSPRYFSFGDNKIMPSDGMRNRKQMPMGQDMQQSTSSYHYLTKIMPQQRYRGRTHTHQRETNDAVPILGADIVMHDAHQESIRQTKARNRELSTKKDMCNRLKHIMNFWREQYPDYYAVGVRELSAQEIADPDKFFYKNQHDIIYSGLNVRMVFTFMAFKKQKTNGKVASHVQIRKYKDAILWGAAQAKESLPSSYYDEMQSFLQSFKKEMAAANTKGQLDKQESDPTALHSFDAF